MPMRCRFRSKLLRWFLTVSVIASAGCHIFKYSIAKNQKDAPLAVDGATLPCKHSQRVSQFIFVTDFDLKTDQPFFRELSELRERIVRDLGLPSPTALVNVYLFEDRERYHRYMQSRYPDLPERRAFFVAQPRASGNGDDLIIFTFHGDHLRQDLRHELTHAVLHSVLKDVPLWLDEGLAEYYELPREARGVNRNHLNVLRRDGVRPDLPRLEQLSHVHQMNQAEYREAWAWVHLMLHGTPESRQAILGYLKQLRFNPAPGPLEPRLRACFPDLENALLQHIAAIR